MKNGNKILKVFSHSTLEKDIFTLANHGFKWHIILPHRMSMTKGYFDVVKEIVDQETNFSKFVLLYYLSEGKFYMFLDNEENAVIAKLTFS